MSGKSSCHWLADRIHRPVAQDITEEREPLSVVRSQPSIELSPGEDDRGRNTDCADRIASLIDPAKLATLGPRGANPRIQKAVAQLDAARKDGQKVEKVAAKAVAIAGYKNAGAKLTAASLVRNYDIANKLGCLDDLGLEEMRRGKSPTIRRGPYKEQQLSVDHIIPRAVVPELDCVIANLELLPLRLNESKNDKIGARQRSLAVKLNEAGLLSAEGLRKVQKSKH